MLNYIVYLILCDEEENKTKKCYVITLKQKHVRKEFDSNSASFVTSHRRLMTSLAHPEFDELFVL